MGCARCSILVIVLAVSVYAAQEPSKISSVLKDAKPTAVKQFVTQYCINCHNSDEKKGDLALDLAGLDDVAAHSKLWEKVVRKLTARQMPPVGRSRPNEQTYQSIVAELEGVLDHAAATRPNPGRT